MECSSHGKPLEVYCDTCDKLICQLCTTGSCNHKYEPLTDVLPETPAADCGQPPASQEEASCHYHCTSRGNPKSFLEQVE